MNKDYLINCQLATLKMEQEKLANLSEELGKVLHTIVEIEDKLDAEGVEYEHTFIPMDDVEDIGAMN